jgi:hypothetical protein
MKSFFVHQVLQQQVDLIQQQHNHRVVTSVMVKDLIQMLIGVMVVVYVRKVKEHVVQTHILVTKNQCINVLTDNFDQNKFFF